MMTFLEYMICEANKNNVLLFGKDDLETLALKEENAEQFFKINIKNDIYKFLKNNVSCPELFSFIINELYDNRQEIPGLFAESPDEQNKFMTSAKDTFINLICIDGSKRNEIIQNVVDIIKSKIKENKDYPISDVSIKHHEIAFTPNKETAKQYRLKKLTIHIVQPTNDRALNKISSDITEFMPAIALKLMEKAPSLVKHYLQLTSPDDIVAFLKKNIHKIEGVAAEDAINSVINGIANNSARPKIIEKVKNGNIMAKYISDYASKFKTVKDAHVTNEKNKNDSADLRVTLDGKDIGFSVKDDKIDGKGHSLRDFSLLKQVSENPEYKEIFGCISFDKYLKDNDISPDQTTKTKQYFVWIGNHRSQQMEDAINANKAIYSKIITYAFNLDNPDTMMLSHSGVHSNNGNDKNNASYNLTLCKELLRKESKNIKLKITGKNELQLYEFFYSNKPLIKYVIQVGAGKYNEVLQTKVEEALNTNNFYIPTVLKFKNLQLKF